MSKFKKTIALSMVAFIALSPMTAKAEDLDGVDLSPVENIMPIEDEVEMELPNYIAFNGKVTNINSEGKSFSILAENDLEEGLDKLVAFIHEDVVLLDDDTLEFITKEDLEEGMEVSIFYYKETPMLMSYPPQLGPDVVVVRNEENNNSVMVDKFDKDLLNSDKSLRLLVNDKTDIVDIAGNKVDKEELEDKSLVVFYDIVLESYPAQTGPKKIIVLNDNSLEILDKIIINGEELELENPLYKNEEGVTMVPIRQIAEKLEYEVEWDQETRSASLVKGPHWMRVTIGEDNYNFAKMLVKLGTAPELTDSRAYVPMSFLEEILTANVEITPDGVLNIIQ